MDAIVEKYSTRIDAKSVIRLVEDIKREYLGDGLQKEDIPPMVARLMLHTSSFKKLDGHQKKKLVIALLYHLIEEIDPGEKDSEFEILIKSMVPPIIDGFATMLKTKQVFTSCCMKP